MTISIVPPDQAVASLEAALAHTREESAAFEAEVEQQRVEFARRASVIENALVALRGTEGGQVASSVPVADAKVGNGNGNGNGASSISDERLGLVEAYMERKQRVRQADIVKDLKLNSGTVSVALRRLESEGIVSATDERERGSRVWTYVPETAETETEKVAAAA